MGVFVKGYVKAGHPVMGYARRTSDRQRLLNKITRKGSLDRRLTRVNEKVAQLGRGKGAGRQNQLLKRNATAVKAFHKLRKTY